MKKIYLCILLLLWGGVEYSSAQAINANGVVIDETGAPIPGTAVTVKGNTGIGVSTGTDGRFSINVPAANSILVFSFIGYEHAEYRAGTNMRVQLQPDALAMEEVVVTGMTTMDRRLFTGATDKLSADNVKLDGVADISRALEGRSAGVSVQNVSATFGTAPKIRIRGATSILGSNKPLWVVDGIVMDDVTDVSSDDLSTGDAVTLISSAIAGLNADDIESFQILKDGSATSIYGARAMAGVIVVTTKRGRAGVTRVNYTGEFTTRLKPTYFDYDIMNSQDQMSIYKEMDDKGWLNLERTLRAKNYGVYGKMYELINKYNPVSGTFELDNTTAAKYNYLRQAEMRNTDWFDLLFKNSVMSSHSVSVTSGNEKVSNYFSLSYLNDPGWYERSKVSRYTANANTTYNFRHNLQLNLRSTASYRTQQAPGSLSQTVNDVYGEVSRDFDINPFSYAMNTSRTLDPDTYYRRNYTGFNIFNELENNYIQLDKIDAKFQGELKWSVIPGLDLSAIGAINYSSSSSKYYIKDNSNIANAYRAMSTTIIRDNNNYLYNDPDSQGGVPVSVMPEGGIYEKREYRMFSYDFRAAANYAKTFNDVHILNLFGGIEFNSIKRSNDWFRGWGMLYDYGEMAYFNYLAFKQLNESGESYYTLDNKTNRNAAYIANGTYSYAGKYVISGTFRYEGTNRLGKSRTARWLPTWNISGAWNAHEENFFENLNSVLSKFTIRASYSLTADAGPSYVTNSTEIIRSYNPFRPTTDVKEWGLERYRSANEDLTYEKKHEFNFGVDMGFLKDRISISMDVYKRSNFDLIGYATTEGVSGEIKRYANIADMESKGVELTLSTRNIMTKDFRWTSDFTFAWSKNKITNLQSSATVMNLIRGSSYSLEGYPVGGLFSIPFAGLDSDGFPMFMIEGKLVTQSDYSGIGSVLESETVVGDFSEISFQKIEGIADWLKYDGPTDPPYTGGFNNNFQYKNWRLGVFFTYAFGNVIRMNPIFSSSYSDLEASSEIYKNRWIMAGDEKFTNVPVIASHYQANTVDNIRKAYSAYNYSTERVAKGDFIRLKEISLGYDFPKPMMEKVGINSLSLKLAATNLFLLYADKKLNGQDPEYYMAGGVSSPLARQFTFTVRLGF